MTESGTASSSPRPKISGLGGQGIAHATAEDGDVDFHLVAAAPRLGFLVALGARP